MGSTPSVNITSPSDFKYFALRFDESDRLRLVAAPRDVITVTKSIIPAFWTIQNIHESQGFIEFKIKGTPFTPSKTLDVNVKFFLCALIKEYYTIGWHIKFSTDLQLYGETANVVIFEKGETIQTQVICLSLNDTDKIRVLAPDVIIPHIRTAIMTFWPAGIQTEQTLDKSFEFKLKGNPWGPMSNDGEESYFSVALMNGIIASLYNIGWVFAASADSGNRTCDVNALYFRNDLIETQKPENKNSRFFSVSLHKTDRVRFVRADPELIMAVKSAIPKFWIRGIQEEKEVNGTYEFKLKGNPWDTDGQEGVEADQLIGCLFSFLSQYNWNLYATCTLTTSLSDKSTFFFRCNKVEKVIPINTMCLGLYGSDKIRILNKDQNIVNTIRNCIMQSWPRGIQEEIDAFNLRQFKLKGNPFSDHGESSVYTTYMMMTILSALESMGMRLISSADLSGKNRTDVHTSNYDGETQVTYVESYTVDLDSWFLHFMVINYRIYELFEISNRF